ncbi:RHS repeat domain-containing protein [Rhabdochromatium marinum]|uniref:RHS repeat domain-containing protein n=1 Tax=Rhabdochromatium marinum TaxID=48729 RepID=UPI001906BCB4|nr:RHS repeat domain-containing protein [Rhabdochromatium marinum]
MHRLLTSLAPSLPALLGIMPLTQAAAANVTYSYDAIGRLTQVSYDTGQSLQYAFDPAGNILSVAVNGTAFPDPDDPTTWPPVTTWGGMTDEDGDDIPDEIEAFAPGRPGPDGQTVAGDNNGDGTPDWQQDTVTAYPTVDDNGHLVWVTLVNDDSGQVKAFTQITDIVWPDGLDLPMGVLDFTMIERIDVQQQSRTARQTAAANTVTGGSVLPLTVITAAEVAVNGFYALNQHSDTWDNLASPAQGGMTALVDDYWQLRFQVKDGGPFDADASVNGEVQIQGAPGRQLSTPQDKLYMNAGDSPLVLDGSFVQTLDFGGIDTYTLSPELSTDVRLVDNQASQINLPEGLVITAGRFLSDGFELTINGHVVRVIGRPDTSRYVIGGDLLEPETKLTYAALAGAFGTTVPRPGQTTPNLAPNPVRVSTDGTLEPVVLPPADAEPQVRARMAATPRAVTEAPEIEPVLDARADAKLRWVASCIGATPASAAIYLTELASGQRWCYTDPADQADPAWRVDQPTLSADGAYLAYRVCVDATAGRAPERTDCWVDLYGPQGITATLAWPALTRPTRLAFSPDGAELWWLETENQAVDGDVPVVMQVNPLR